MPFLSFLGRILVVRILRAGLACAAVVGGALAQDVTPAPIPPGSPTVLGISGTHFTVNGRPTFLLGLSYYGGLGASDAFIRDDLDEAARLGFNWIRVWANWRAFDADAAAVDGEGRIIPAGMAKLKALLRECDRRGMIVDVSLSRANGVSGPPRLQTMEAHVRAVETLVGELQPWRNWYLDLSNERNIGDKRHASVADLATLRRRVRELAPTLLVTASHGGDIDRAEAAAYVSAVGVDFLTPHRPRSKTAPGTTERATRQLLEWAASASGRPVPVHHQEPFRRGYGTWQPSAQDFLADLDAARRGGAAGWCFHNGDQRKAPDGRPRRSFDVREKKLFDQLDSEEQAFLKLISQQKAQGKQKDP